MKKRNTLKKIAGIALAASFTLGATSCTLFATDSKKDMAQMIASVDITRHKDFKSGEYAPYASVVGKANGTILKRDLIAYFLNVGSSYVQNYGYKETFKMLMDSLVSRKIIVQYAMTYYLAETDDYTVAGHDEYVEAQAEAITDKEEKSFVLSHPQILTMRYFLTEKEEDGSVSEDNYYKAEYELKKVVNSTLDSTEQGYIDEEKDEDDETFGEARTTPTGVGTEKEDFFDKDYDIYTGHNTIDSCGDSYEALDGSTQMTRRKAYNDFLANLSANNLIGKDVQTTDFTKIDYYYVELAAQLEQALINKFSEDLNESASDELNETYVKGKYEALINSQKNIYDADPNAFVTAIQAVSDDSFVVYSPATGSKDARFGFVYNILIPFSATDNQTLDIARGEEGLEALDVSEQKEYYKKRSEILANVQAKDQRAAWFSNNEDSNYAFAAEAGTFYTSAHNEGKGNHLFFEDNFKNTERYEELKHYLGKYPYNGTVTRDKDGKITAVRPNAISIDEFIDEMEEYIDYALGAGATEDKAVGTPFADYKTDGSYTVTDGKFDYSEFIYYTGKVALSDSSLDNYFYKESDGYKAVSAINELMFAYSTDTGCFNTYFGYEVSSITDKYVKEFAYAAQYAVIDAVDQGTGTYVVCATEYGWHIMYVSVKYDIGNAYDNGFVWAEKDKEGTFSNLWFEALKKATSDVRMEKKQKEVLGSYNNDTAVKKYQSRYQDLLDLE